MTHLPGLVAQILHIALMTATAPLVSGLVVWLEARLCGRSGVSPLEPWRMLVRLARKQPVVAQNATLLSRAGPVVQLAAVAVAAALVPSFALGMTSAPLADLLVLAGLLMLGRSTVAFAAMDTGEAVGGIGASRAMGFAAFAEPALVMVIFTLSWRASSSNLDRIAALSREGALGSGASVLLAAAALGSLALADTVLAGRPGGSELIGVGRPLAHEFSGRDLALIEGATHLRRLLWLTMIATIFLPLGLAPAGSSVPAWAVGVASWFGKVLGLSAVFALFGMALAPAPSRRIPTLLGLVILLGLLAAMLLFVGEGTA
ncbi:MAG: NADH-quinone oxidoreductase subunit H [Acetobacteraceae bacterium]|nr:NADH-quinone oxidoreductase subunit H [Acetobacteraceae bacterium]